MARDDPPEIGGETEPSPVPRASIVRIRGAGASAFAAGVAGRVGVAVMPSLQMATGAGVSGAVARLAAPRVRREAAAWSEPPPLDEPETSGLPVGRASVWPRPASRPRDPGPVRAALAGPPAPASAPTVPAAADDAGQRLADRMRRGNPRVLDASVQGFLGGLLGLTVRPIRPHDDAAADELARRSSADAVSLGDDVAFRAGRFRPHEPAGAALIAHEWTHAAAAEARPRAVSGAAAAAEESSALVNEHRAFRALTRPDAPVPVAPSARLSALPPAPAPVPATAPRAAAIDRPGPGIVSPPHDEPTGPTGLTDRQLAALRQVVYRDLMDRIRTGVERGG
jgi:hypothetical protein